jgi:RNA polymerase sigma factor (sigma-70 family)
MATMAPEVPVLARDEAFEQLYRRYVKDVYHYALALLRNPADAEDVTQTTFLNAYRAYQRGEEILKPQNWLIKIAHNVARTRYARSSRRVKEVPLDEHLDQLALPEEERPDVEGVLRALGRLPFNQRAALVMRELEGRPYSEIGDTLGVSVAAVETLIFRARRSLRVRASALRSLGAVPLPASLAQMFEGGGFVGGGIGAGFLVKAAVALVAGSLATGLGGDQATRVVAAPESAAGTATASPDAAGVIANADRASMQQPAAHRAAVERRGAASRLADRVQVNPTSPGRAETRPAGSSVQPSTSTSSSSSATAVVTETADSAVSAVEQAVTAAVAALPVQPPPLPVQPPQLPELP